jgi:RNA recognition motif-containing protein
MIFYVSDLHLMHPRSLNKLRNCHSKVYKARILTLSSTFSLDLTQEDVRSVFEAFGKITSCEMAPCQVYGRHKGYCFVEYATEQVRNDTLCQ